MIEEYGVGRAFVREALRILEVQGLISIKAGPGGGPVVAEVSTRDFGRMSTLYFQVGGMTFRELIGSDYDGADARCPRGRATRRRP